MLCSFIISSRKDAIAATRVVLVDIDIVAGNLLDRVVVICGRVVGIELVVVGVKNARNVLAWKGCFGFWIFV